MNKIKTLYIVWGIVVIIVIALLTAFGFMYKNKTSSYKELEKEIAAASKRYVEIQFSYPAAGESIKVPAEKLIEKDLIGELKINDEVCTGYAIISRPATVYEYKGYVSCENYQTKGYEK